MVEPIVLNVRSMTISDIDAVAGWFDSIDDVSFFERSAVVPLPLEAVRESWREDFDFAAMPPKALWYIAEDRSGRPAAIGGLRLINYVNGDAVLPAFVARDMRRQGVAVRLVAMLLDIALFRLRLVRVTTYYREDNLVSARITQTAGFHEEGRLRKAMLANGSHLDMVVMGVLREEWLARREELHAELDCNTVLRYSGPGNEQYDWPRDAMADRLVADLTARRQMREASGCARIA